MSKRSHKSSKKVLNTLMKRTITPPWAIVRSLARRPRTNVRPQPHTHTHTHTDLRANDRPALCDRSHTGYPAPRDLFRSRHPHSIIFTLPSHNPRTHSFTPSTLQHSQTTTNRLKSPPITTNHHQITPNHHPSAPYLHLRPPHSSSSPHLPFFPSSINFEPNLQNPPQ
jgi:hypothetical protein